jgi:hypothetical protein
MSNNRILFSSDFVLKDGKIGINTADPQSLLDVAGDVRISGVSTFSSNVDVGESANIGNNLNVSGVSTLGTLEINSGILTATSGIITYYGEFNGDLAGNRITSGIASISNLSVSGVSTLGTLEINSGIVTASSGIITYYGEFNGDLAGNRITSGIASISNLSVSGVSTLGTIRLSSGIVTSTSGVVTYYGDGSNLTGIRGVQINVQPITSDPTYPLLASGIGVNTVGLSTGNLVFIPSLSRLGIGTTVPTAGLSIGSTTITQALDIGTDLKVSSSGAFNPRVTIGSSVGAALTEKMEISAISRDNGLLEIANYGGNQLFSVSNNQSESAFSVYRYGNYSNLSIRTFENRNLFSVSPTGIVTTSGALRVGTSNTSANSSTVNEFYGGLNLRAPFSTSTQYVSVVPKFNDRGALSFEAPVGTAQTDRGTQIFSISNNLSSSIFRVNNLDRTPLFEVSTSGNVGVGTTNPRSKLQVNGNLRVTSVGSTPTEQIDINHYRNVAYQPAIGVATDNRGAISFDSLTGISSGANTYFPASLMALVNGGNVFSAMGYQYWSGGLGEPGIDVTVENRIGIGTARPRTDFEIRRNTAATGNFQIQNKIIFSENINPGINSTTTIDLEPYTPGITTSSPTRGSLLFAGALDQSLNGGQLVTVVNDNTSLFTVNRFAGLSTTNVTGTRSVETVVQVTSTGRVGIGTTLPSTRVDVRGDVRVGINTSQGLILTSPNGTTFRLIVDNSGNLSTIPVTI